MKNLVFIENLKCGGCAASIRKGLSALPGVTNVEVDLEQNAVTVETPDSDSRALILSTLDALGYPEAGHNSLMKKGKSFVSCAIGRMSDYTVIKVI